MADLSDVLNAGRDLCGSVLYPSGGNGNAAGVGLPVTIAVGWPSPQSLDAAIAANVAMLTVYAPPGMHRNTTRGLDDTIDLSVELPTWTLTVSGQTITVGGQGASPYSEQNLTVLVNGQAYVAPTTGASDTASSLAAALEALIALNVAGCSVSGAVITLPSSARIGRVFVGAQGQVYREIKRQEHVIQFTVWAPTPEARDAIIKAIDPVMAAQTFLVLPDQTSARFRYVDDRYNDFDQKQGVFRRDLQYSAEYATILINPATQIGVVSGGVNWQDANFEGSGEITFEGDAPITFGDYEEIITA